MPDRAVWLRPTKTADAATQGRRRADREARAAAVIRPEVAQLVGLCLVCGFDCKNPEHEPPAS